MKDETGCQHITSRVRAESVHAGMKVGERVSPTGDLWWCVGCGGLFADDVAMKPLALPTATGPWDDADDEWSDRIKAAHPTRNGSHETYATAMRMVGARRSKGALVELVNWLLQR